jgi:nucleotidyltransferase substrate binding protein (TIGR01987 family)
MDYTQLKTAIERFGEMLEAFRHNDQRGPLERQAVQDSLIKRFEYTLESAWKTCKRHLEEEGFTEAATGSPKSIIRLAAQRNLIADPEKWFGYLRLRLDILHDYSSDKAEAILDITKDFYQDVTEFFQGMTEKAKKEN